MATPAKIEGSAMIVRVLAEQGVKIIFGYSGGAILPTYDAVFRYNSENQINGKDPMPLIVPANEQGADLWLRATPEQPVNRGWCW